MIRIPVGLGERKYDVLLDVGGIGRAGASLAKYARGGRLIVVTETNVATHILPRFVDSLASQGIIANVIELPPGESTKSWAQLERLCDALIGYGAERSDTIIALGGGVIGDLVGLAAAILKRGCKFIQVPTTLLAQVDSSVGGKTAINTRAGKNLVGAFYQPALVMIDPEALDTLSQRDVRAGYAEVVKYGLINDFAFFEWCETNGHSVLAGDRTAQTYAIETSVRAKAVVVEADERETDDVRALLNLGHTFGHALEAEHGFRDSLLHGEAVAAGMALAYRFSAKRGLCSENDATRVAEHLRAMGLPDGLSAAHSSASGATLVDFMTHDKKMKDGTLPFILARGIGQAFVDKGVALCDVVAFLDEESR